MKITENYLSFLDQNLNIHYSLVTMLINYHVPNNNKIRSKQVYNM
jgi:hypothetical protein